MKKLLLLAAVAVALVGCGSEPEVIVVTATPDPATSTPLPTDTPEPTATDTPEPTATPVPPTPTPDVRVISAAPRSMLPERTDLPVDGRFYLTYESPHRNSEILSGWGTERGRDYLDASGRIDGWSIEYARGTRTVKAPEWVWYNAIIYQTAEGHVATEQELGRCDEEDGWNEIPAPEGVIYLCEWRRTQPNGNDYMQYEAKVNYRNIGVQIAVGGYEGEFDLDWLFDRVAFQLETLEAMPLSETVTYSP